MFKYLAIAIIAAQSILATEMIGPYKWARKLYDPNNPQDAAISQRGDIESATINNNYITLTQWQGYNKLGTRCWGGNTLVGPVGKNYFIGLQNFNIIKPAQDAHLRIGFSKISNPTVEHAAFQGINGTVLWDTVVVELAFRSNAWQMGDYNGTPLQCGIWAVPEGMTLAQVQNDTNPNPTYLLGKMTFLTECPPANDQISFKLQVQTDGQWQLLVDIWNNQTIDIDLTSEQINCKRHPFTGLGEQSGLIITTSPAGGNMDPTNTTEIIRFCESNSEPVSQPYRNRRPFITNIPSTSNVSPVEINGYKYTPTSTITGKVNGSPIIINSISNMFMSNIPLTTPQNTIEITQQANDSTSPPTINTGIIHWTPLDLATKVSADTIAIRKGDNIKFTATGAGNILRIDCNKDTINEYEGAVGGEVTYIYNTTGTTEAIATIDNVFVGAITIIVTEITFQDLIACEVGYTTTTDINTGINNASDITFTARDTTTMTVSVMSISGNFVRLNIKPLKRTYNPIKTYLIGLINGQEIAAKEVQEFTINTPASKAIGVNGSGIGRSSLVMYPFIGGVNFKYSMFASTSTFLYGYKNFEVNTSAQTSTIGEPGFTIFQDPVKPLEYNGNFYFTVEIPNNEFKYCLSITAYNGNVKISNSK